MVAQYLQCFHVFWIAADDSFHEGDFHLQLTDFSTRQFLIFGTLCFIFQTIMLGITTIGIFLFLFGTCHIKGRLLWTSTFVIWISCLYCTFIYIRLYIALPFELLFTEWIFGVLNIHKLTFLIDTRWPMWRFQQELGANQV